MASNYQEESGSGNSSRGGYSGKRRNHSKPFRGNNRNNQQAGRPPADWNNPQTEYTGTDNVNQDNYLAQSAAPRGRGASYVHRNNYRRQPAETNQARQSYPEAYPSNNAPQNYYANETAIQQPYRAAENYQQVPQANGYSNNHQGDSRGGRSNQRGREDYQQMPRQQQPRNPQFRNTDYRQNPQDDVAFNQYANHAGPSAEYGSRAPQAKPKQSRGPKQSYSRNYRGGVNAVPTTVFENQSLQPSASVADPSNPLEHFQPFENIRQFTNFQGRPAATAPRVQQDRAPAREERSFRDRNEREESYGSQDRSKRDDRQYKGNRPYVSQNWRADDQRRGPTSYNNFKKEEIMADSATQRERLTTQLTSGTYECMVCCESVKQAQPIWNCSQCFHVFHLGCVRRWSKSSQDESGHWRCPGCQLTVKTLPNAYFCYCSKRKDPEWNRRETPHSCGEVCAKALGDGVSCSHTCTLLCHPGPCPICSAQTQRKCPCGKTSQLVKCGSLDALLCGEPCGKLLSCGLHLCEETCHVGACQSCSITVEQSCYCGQSKRELPCSIEHPEEDKFACELVCTKKLSCGRHHCEKNCHSGDCGACHLEVATVTICPCGKVELKQLYKTKKMAGRKICTDPVPTCGEICGKTLTCGPPENRHSCKVSCHSGPCPSCPLSTVMKCRCGRNEKDIPCVNLRDLTEVLCERRCNKKRHCGRHKCGLVCCVDTDHICTMVCGRTLSCGLHRCEALCHAGNCNRCYQVSFDELRCHCTTQVMYPPVPCGARPPECDRPCIRPRSCGHQTQHNCHSDASGCPPCTTLCEKLCYGKHEKRKNIPCHLTQVSCGKSCGRPLKCGRHNCTVNCHTGPCPTSCSQACPIQRPECGHPCNLPCHEGSCPGTSCREKIKVQCQCGQRSATVSCEENEISYRKIATGLLATKMAQLQSGECVDLKDLLGKSAVNKTRSLECNEECALVERNRRLALALQIKNPNPKPGAPTYPDLLKDWAKKDPRFVQMVHDKLTELVQLAKQSVGKMKSRSYSFDSMNRDKRQFIHEYCAFFGCESMSYDEEPKRNVVATAFGDLSFLPGVGILDVSRRELGQRKMPAPPGATRGVGMTVLTSGSQQQQQQQQPTQPAPQQPPPNVWGKKGPSGFKTLSDVVKSTPAPQKTAPEPAAPAKPEPKPTVVDYFDFTS